MGHSELQTAQAENAEAEKQWRTAMEDGAKANASEAVVVEQLRQRITQQQRAEETMAHNVLEIVRHFEQEIEDLQCEIQLATTLEVPNTPAIRAPNNSSQAFPQAVIRQLRSQLDTSQSAAQEEHAIVQQLREQPANIGAQEEAAAAAIGAAAAL